MGLMLDSSILIAAERRRFDLPAFSTAHAEHDLFIAAITASELLHGVERADTKARRSEKGSFAESILQRIPVIDFDLATARRHAALWASLEKRGQIIGPHDLEIAATALTGGHSLATLNRAEFRRVTGLKLVDVTSFEIAR